MKVGLLKDKNTNLGDEEDHLHGRLSNSKSLMKTSLGMSSFLYKLHQWEAFKMRKKKMASISLLARAWWWIEVKEARRQEGKTLES